MLPRTIRAARCAVIRRAGVHPMAGLERVTIMSKGMDSKKTTKKKPEKTLKEKRAAKDLKKKSK